MNLDTTNLMIALLVAVIGLAIIVFAMDWSDRRRNQRTLQLLNDLITNEEVRKAIGGISASDDTPAGMSFVTTPDPHDWTVYFEARVTPPGKGAEWPIYVVEKWERNELGETRYVENRSYIGTDRGASR